MFDLEELDRWDDGLTALEARVAALNTANIGTVLESWNSNPSPGCLFEVTAKASQEMDLSEV